MNRDSCDMETSRTVRSTYDLTTDELAQIRELMTVAFEGDFSESDWEHSLGGQHALIRYGSSVVAHASVVPRTLWVDQSVFNAGYVEAVAVLPEHQKQGLGTAVMRMLEPVLEVFDFCALSTGEHRFYERLGWERWRGPTFVRLDGEDVRTADEDDGIMIRRTKKTGRLSLASEIVCEPRTGDDW